MKKTSSAAGTAYARLRYFLAVCKTRLLRKHTPVICVLVVNNRCNLKCKYCFGSYSDRKVRDYTTEELKSIIDYLAKSGTRYLNIHGGETLLREDIGTIVDYIKKKGIYCCLITNGTLLRQRINDIRNVDNLTISLDGRRENHDRNRGEGTFDKAMEAIRLAIKEKIPLRVSATITRYTMNDVGYLANLAKEMGFTLYFSILFKPLLPAIKEFEMTHEEITRTLQEIIEQKKRGLPVFTSMRALEYARDWPVNHNLYHFLDRCDAHLLPKGFKPIPCYYGDTKYTIEADGNVYPCFLLVGSAKFKPLNWREVGLEKAIENVRLSKTCITCPALTQNDHNLLLGLDPAQIIHVTCDQIKEALRRK